MRPDRRVCHRERGLFFFVIPLLGSCGLQLPRAIGPPYLCSSDQITPAAHAAAHGSDIMRIRVLSIAVALGIVACGGGDAPGEAPPASESAEPSPAPPTEEFGMPSWMQVDHTARTVAVQLEAGATEDNNRWNFNGAHSGSGGITVPSGYTVTVSFQNQDPAMAHSVGIDEAEPTYPNVFSEVTPAFPGGVTADPTSMMDATMPGEAEDMSFVAGEPGEYAFLCYVTGHAALGMWIQVTVSDSDEVGALM